MRILDTNMQTINLKSSQCRNANKNFHIETLSISKLNFPAVSRHTPVICANFIVQYFNVQYHSDLGVSDLARQHGKDFKMEFFRTLHI